MLWIVRGHDLGVATVSAMTRLSQFNSIETVMEVIVSQLACLDCILHAGWKLGRIEVDGLVESDWSGSDLRKIQ